MKPLILAIFVQPPVVLVECRQLRENGKDSPDLMSLLDLVALATVADVALLVGVNRAFVHQGLKVIAAGTSWHGGTGRLRRGRQRPEQLSPCYVLGPRINAGGRIGQADLVCVYHSRS